MDDLFPSGDPLDDLPPRSNLEVASRAIEEARERALLASVAVLDAEIAADQAFDRARRTAKRS